MTILEKIAIIITLLTLLSIHAVNVHSIVKLQRDVVDIQETMVLLQNSHNDMIRNTINSRRYGN